MSATVGSTAWFDNNLHNVAIRNLAKADFQDSVLSRSDMIGLFRQVANGRSDSGRIHRSKNDREHGIECKAGVDYMRPALIELRCSGKFGKRALSGQAAGEPQDRLQRGELWRSWSASGSWEPTIPGHVGLGHDVQLSPGIGPVIRRRRPIPT